MLISSVLCLLTRLDASLGLIVALACSYTRGMRARLGSGSAIDSSVKTQLMDCNAKGWMAVWMVQPDGLADQQSRISIRGHVEGTGLVSRGPEPVHEPASGLTTW